MVKPLTAAAPLDPAVRRVSGWQIFAVFLRLGLTCFGGPIAHIGYFRTEFVTRRRWLTEQRFAELVSVTQFLPGPGSSQCGFGIGLLCGGWTGALAAFSGFTLPSVLLMFAFARVELALTGEWGRALLHGLQLVAVVVVAQAVLGMARQLAPDLRRVAIAAAAAGAVLMLGQWWAQLAAIALGAVCGWLWCRDVPVAANACFAVGFGARASAALWTIFTALLLLSLYVPADSLTAVRMAAGLYQSGALVFGGGHVVLPLLQQTMVATGLISTDAFVAGYGAAQAVPGPMFSIAAYLGARLGGLWFALLAVIAIFLPGLLLLAASLPVWNFLVGRPIARFMLAGVNAAVLGILAAALYDLLRPAVSGGTVDVFIAVAGFAMLSSWPRAAVGVVLWCVGATVLHTAMTA